MGRVFRQPAGNSGAILFPGMFAVFLVLCLAAVNCFATDLNPDPPASPVKLIFIHHSTGENWLTDDNGGLGIALRNNNYFVSDTNYGWGPDNADLGGPVGDYTDIGQWWNWFNGPISPSNTEALFTEYSRHSYYTRMAADPGGENEIIMFKSCFPNSALKGNPHEPPPVGDNPLRGQGSGSDYQTVANAKGIYSDLLPYCASRQDKLFVVITASPLRSSAYAGNARAFNNWLVNEWLKDYPFHNVAVFDFYNVLTSNGGNPNVNDLGKATGNHHRFWNSAIQHKTDGGSNVLAYPTDDDHPSKAGNLKGTGEYLPLLNMFYHCWKGSGGCPAGTAHTLTVTKGGNGTGTVTSSPSGINCGSQCSATFGHDEVVTLTASPAPGSVFGGWEGGSCSGQASTCMVMMAADLTVKAAFTREEHRLTVMKYGGGTGTVTSSPSGINCGSQCSGLFQQGSLVTLTAAAGPGSVFTGWSGTCGGTGTCTVTLNADGTVGAGFVPAVCTYSISPPTRVYPANAASSPVAVTARGVNCVTPGIVSSDPSWLTASLQSSAKNRWAVRVSVTANPGSQKRSGTVTIEGGIVSVTQAGASCRIVTLVPASQDVPPTGGDYTFAVSVTPADCDWTTNTLAPWVHITSGSGTGGGTVSYSVNANPNPRTRSGVINVVLTQNKWKRKPFSVKQTK